MCGAGLCNTGRGEIRRNRDCAGRATKTGLDRNIHKTGLRRSGHSDCLGVFTQRTDLGSTDLGNTALGEVIHEAGLCGTGLGGMGHAS
jgi:hypothetical protein